jgi:hypothetical protein
MRRARMRGPVHRTASASDFAIPKKLYSNRVDSASAHSRVVGVQAESPGIAVNPLSLRLREDARGGRVDLDEICGAGAFCIQPRN